MNKAIVLFLVIVSALACKQNDQEKIIGKWQSDDEWFEYLSDNTYNSGRATITMVSHFKYTIDAQKKELTMYTDSEKQTYYLKYLFVGNDTLKLNNVLNTEAHFATFYRVKK